VHEVYDKGAAAKDGRLLPGDQILEVRYLSVADITWIVNVVCCCWLGLMVELDQNI